MARHATGRMSHAHRNSNHLTALALFVAMVGLAYPLFTSTPERIAATAGRLVAAGASVGTSMVIPENPYNSLAQELKDKQIALDEREQALNKKPAISTIVQGTWSDRLGVYSFFISIILLVLIGFNFYYDVSRQKKRTPLAGKYSVDLR